MGKKGRCLIVLRMAYYMYIISWGLLSVGCMWHFLSQSRGSWRNVSRVSTICLRHHVTCLLFTPWFSSWWIFYVAITELSVAVNVISEHCLQMKYTQIITVNLSCRWQSQIANMVQSSKYVLMVCRSAEVRKGFPVYDYIHECIPTSR